MQVEAQNIELKRHLGEMVASHDEDKQEAIEELREEYEEQLREGVKETQELMEGEVRRLKVEVEVLTQTLLEVRSSLTREGDQSERLHPCIRKGENKLCIYTSTPIPFKVSMLPPLPPSHLAW